MFNVCFGNVRLLYLALDAFKTNYLQVFCKIFFLLKCFIYHEHLNYSTDSIKL